MSPVLVIDNSLLIKLIVVSAARDFVNKWPACPEIPFNSFMNNKSHCIGNLFIFRAPPISRAPLCEHFKTLINQPLVSPLVSRASPILLLSLEAGDNCLLYTL